MIDVDSVDIAALIPARAESHITRISLSALSLNHFRNYSAARLQLSSEPVILTGRNGAGKTNILEAISFLTPGRGIRRAKLSELDNKQSPGTPWAISATVQGMRGEIKIGTGRDAESPETERRIVRIDGKSMRGQAELAQHVAMLWLTPQMEQLFQEGASAGRKFLDRLVYSFDPDHASRVNEYEFAMRERNRLLQLPMPDSAWLSTLEQTMAETAAAIAQSRMLTVGHVNHAILQSTLSFPKAHMQVHGFMEDRLQEGLPAVQAEDALRTQLQAGRRQDAAAGRTLTGTHRSELWVMHRGKNMPAQDCSTGEQKAMLLSITLSQARAGMMWHGVVPLLLLDEVAAHLDAVRRQELFEELLHIGAQTWMTGTDAALFAGLEDKAQFFQVEHGAVAPRLHVDE